MLKKLLGWAKETPPLVGTTDAAPDGNYDALRSGKWPAQEPIPVAAFPFQLLLTDADKRLGAPGSKEILLATTRVGPHQVELLLAESDSDALALSMRIPTAANQYREPYVLMEAEPGNSREEVLRDFHFHLTGRVSPTDIIAMDWSPFFEAAAEKLEALRGRVA